MTSPAYFELHEVPADLDADEIVATVIVDGRRHTCQVLDHTNICAVIATA